MAQFFTIYALLSGTYRFWVFIEAWRFNSTLREEGEDDQVLCCSEETGESSLIELSCTSGAKALGYLGLTSAVWHRPFFTRCSSWGKLHYLFIYLFIFSF